MSDNCQNCGGLIPEPYKAYGYAGKVCHCNTPSLTGTQPQQPVALGDEKIAVIKNALKAGEMLAIMLSKEGGAASTEIIEEELPLIRKAIVLLSTLTQPKQNGGDEPSYYTSTAFTPKVMVVCEHCGNKRCPHSQNKAYQCTNSNVPNQVSKLTNPDASSSEVDLHALFRAYARDIEKCANEHQPSYGPQIQVPDELIDSWLKYIPAQYGAKPEAMSPTEGMSRERVRGIIDTAIVYYIIGKMKDEPQLGQLKGSDTKGFTDVILNELTKSNALKIRSDV